MIFIISICASALFLIGYQTLQRRNMRKVKAVRSLKEKEVVEAIGMHFKSIDIIKGEKRWLGSDSEIVYDRFRVRCEDGFRQKLLCRTNKGAWFVIIYHMNQTTVDYVELCPSDESTARDWLSADRELYAQYFSMPETA